MAKPSTVAHEPMPGSIEPMLAKASPELPRDETNWSFEVKWDGVRAIAFIEGGQVRLQTRNLLDSTRQFPELAPLGDALAGRAAVLDGEIVAFAESGDPSFERLQGRLGLTREADVRRRMQDIPIAYMIFDLLYLEGRSLMGLPYRERRELLEGLALKGANWDTPAAHTGPGAGTALFAAMRERHFEGVIAKRLDSTYQPGSRGPSWLKIKHNLGQEFVIGGWTPGVGNRERTLGALLVGYFDRTRAEAEAAGVPQRFHLAGRVGTGFSDALLRTLIPRLQELRRDDAPFDVGVAEPLTIFVEPELVAELEFREWTEAGTMRHPSFKGLRPDKDARDVVLETAPGGAPLATEVVSRPSPRLSAARRASPRPADGTKVTVQVDGRQLVLSNLEKVLYPSGFTKAQVIDYYTRIAPFAVPHYAGRATTLKRYPNGSDAAFFYEKDTPGHRPDWVQTAAIWSGHTQRNINYVLVDDLPTMVWLANLAALELHPSLSLAADPPSPTSVVFDLDPGPPAAILECAGVALMLRDLFVSLGLQSVVKTSGSKGMQVYVPLNSPATYEQTKGFSNAVARLLEREHPKRVVSVMTKNLRTGKVFVDWSQNDEHKTTIGVYSLRARERPFVSTPVAWDEVEAAVASKNASDLAFDATAVLDRVSLSGDLFAPLETLVQELPALG